MVFNLSVQMLHSEQDALDAAQGVFEKVLLKKESFREESQFSTWVYSIAYHYLVDEIRRGKREAVSFELFENDISHFEEYRNELGLTPAEEKIYIEQIKIGCTRALLQCLDPESRFIYILGSIFDFPRKEAAEICGITPGSFRMNLSRSKKKVRNFMTKNCGLVNSGARCRCGRRILIAAERGRVNLEKEFYHASGALIDEYVRELNEADEIARIYRGNPYLELTAQEIFRIQSRLSVLRDTPCQTS